MAGRADAGAGAVLPLFPLGTVLLPGGPLQLRIFEPRYLDMIGRCLREGTGFGVVLILVGAEAGPGATRSTAPVGTSAGIVDFSRLPDGLLGIRCQGERRFRVLARREQADGLWVGDVQWLAEPAPAPTPARHARLADVLRQALPRLGDLYPGTPRFADAQWVGLRLTELLPLAQSQKQRLLELDDPLERLDELALLLAEP